MIDVMEASMDEAKYRKAERAATVLAMAYGIVAYVGPREWLGWTRRKWARQRRRFNSERRRYPLRIVRIGAPEDPEALLAALRPENWHVVSAGHAPVSRRNFDAYVRECLMDWRVPMVRA